LIISFSEDDDAVQEIASMPGVARYGLNRLKMHLEPLVANGLSSILLFGVIDTLTKVRKSSRVIYYIIV